MEPAEERTLTLDIVGTLRAAGCVFAEDEARLIHATARSEAELSAMVDRRAAGLPLEHVLGWAEFRGLRVAVDPGVFVPRRRTEYLVDQAVASAPASGAVVVDLCCGSGALGLAVAAALEGVELYATDVEPGAVRCAGRNLAGRGRVFEGDLFSPLPASLRGQVDVLLANVPYVPSDEIALLPSEARDHEPRVTLDGGADGLGVLRRVAAGAGEWLTPGGRLYFEVSERQVEAAVEAVGQGGLTPEVMVCEDLDATVLCGRAGL